MQICHGGCLELCTNLDSAELMLEDNKSHGRPCTVEHLVQRICRFRTLRKFTSPGVQLLISNQFQSSSFTNGLRRRSIGSGILPCYSQVPKLRHRSPQSILSRKITFNLDRKRTINITINKHYPTVIARRCQVAERDRVLIVTPLCALPSQLIKSFRFRS